MSSVFLYKLSSLLHPPSKYSKANLGILFLPFPLSKKPMDIFFEIYPFNYDSNS